MTNQSKTTLELSIKDMLITCKSNISKKLDRNGLTVENADNIIHYVKEEALKSKDCNKRILFEMIKDFIESVTLDHYIASGVLEKHTHLIEKQISDSKIVPIKNQDVITNYHNNNRLGIKRETVYSEIQKCKSYNVIVLHGPKHSGKSAFLEWFINNPQINGQSFNVRFMYRGTDFQNSSILADIIRHFTREYTGSITVSEMENNLKKHFDIHNKILIIVDDVDIIELESFRIFFESFSRIKGNVTFLLTCQQEESDKIGILKCYNFNPTVIKMWPTVNISEWQNIVNQLAINDPTINNIIDADTSLAEWIFDFAPDKELTVLQQILYYFQKRIEAGVAINSIKKGINAQTLFDISETEKIYNGVTNDAKSILIAFTLVDFPMTISMISKLTSIPQPHNDGGPLEGSALDKALYEIKCQFLLYKRKEIDDVSYFTTSREMKEYLSTKLNSPTSTAFGKHIISAFAKYCIKETEPLNMCFDKLDLLKTLDVENSPDDININVIKNLLSLCESHELYEDFYELSFNTRYYFFKRHQSGSGRKSIHYRRAIAGRKLNQPQYEFEALLYFCNICSKTKEYDYVDDAFDRLIELCNSASIPYDLKCKYQYVLGLYHFSHDDFENANKHFEESIRMTDAYYRLDYIRNNKSLYYDYLTAKRWDCDCLSRLAENGNVEVNKIIEKIELLLDEVENGSEYLNFTTAVAHAKLIRGRIYKLIPEMRNKLHSVIEQLHKYEFTIKNDIYYRTQYESILASLNQ